MEFRISKIDDWQTVTEAIIPRLEHNILLLKGNLGAGKTTFTQYLLKKMGSTDAVSSPTYSIVNEYDTPEGIIFHFDLYRLKNAAEADDIGIQEYLDQAQLCIIEWPEVYMEELEYEKYHVMTIETAGTERVVNFQ